MMFYANLDGSFIDHLRDIFPKILYPFQNLCNDQSLLLFKGQAFFKQYIPSKIWCKTLSFVWLWNRVCPKCYYLYGSFNRNKEKWQSKQGYWNTWEYYHYFVWVIFRQSRFDICGQISYPGTIHWFGWK